MNGIWEYEKGAKGKSRKGNFYSIAATSKGCRVHSGGSMVLLREWCVMIGHLEGLHQQYEYGPEIV